MTTIKRLVVGQIVTLLIALVALGLALHGLSAKTDAIQTSRRDSRLDNCYLLRGLVSAAAPPSQQDELEQYLKTSPLANCIKYADRLPK